MNLADAIRKAAAEGSIPTVGEIPNAFQPKTIGANEQNSCSVADPTASVSFGNAPEPPSPAVLGGNVVRIELFMSAEQTTSMLRAIMIGQHTVLTLIEAAHYLRVRPQTLAKMAEESVIPGIEIDGKWRFLKVNLDEWLYSTIGQGDSDEEAADVA